MRGRNIVILLGNVARDPDVRQFQSDAKVARFSLAVGREWKDKATGEKKTQTDFIPIVCWGFHAELAEKYLQKGKAALIEGRMQVREYEDRKTGGRKWATEVIAENITLLSSGNQEGGHTASPPSRAPSGNRAPADDFEEDFPLDFSDVRDGDSADCPF
jgi:single-strand DNA-binding protein